MSKKKGIPLHEWQKIARVESVREDLASPSSPLNFSITDLCANVKLYFNEPLKTALEPYLADAGKTPDAS